VKKLNPTSFINVKDVCHEAFFREVQGAYGVGESTTSSTTGPASSFHVFLNFQESKSNVVGMLWKTLRIMAEHRS